MQKLPINNEEAPSLTLGQRLKMAREAKGLTVEAIARQLFVGKQLIMGLEEDDYSKIGAPVYVRGHIISYAKLLNITDIAPLLTELAKFDTKLKNADQVSPSLPGRMANTSQDKRRCGLFCVAIILVIIALIAFGYSYYRKYSGASETVSLKVEGVRGESMTKIDEKRETQPAKSQDIHDEKQVLLPAREGGAIEPLSIDDDLKQETTTTSMQIPQTK